MNYVIYVSFCIVLILLFILFGLLLNLHNIVIFLISNTHLGISFR